MKRVAVYYRVSTDKQDLDSQSHAVERYLQELPESARPQKVLVFKDEAVSGKTELGSRPGGKELLKAVATRAVDAVIIFRLDRLTRVTTAGIRLALDFDDAGVRLISVSEPSLNIEGSMRHVMLACVAVFAQIERETTISRVKAGLAKAKAQGKVFGRPWKISALVQAKARALRAQGMTVKNIASELALSMGSVHKLINGPDLPDHAPPTLLKSVSR